MVVMILKLMEEGFKNYTQMSTHKNKKDTNYQLISVFT